MNTPAYPTREDVLKAIRTVWSTSPLPRDFQLSVPEDGVQPSGYSNLWVIPVRCRTSGIPARQLTGLLDRIQDEIEERLDSHVNVTLDPFPGNGSEITAR